VPTFSSALTWLAHRRAASRLSCTSAVFISLSIFTSTTQCVSSVSMAMKLGPVLPCPAPEDGQVAGLIHLLDSASHSGLQDVGVDVQALSNHASDRMIILTFNVHYSAI
jgi:hypothetical protein